MPTILAQYRQTFSPDFQLKQQAQLLFPDGVTHDIRYADPYPIYVDRAQGSR